MFAGQAEIVPISSFCLYRDTKTTKITQQYIHYDATQNNFSAYPDVIGEKPANDKVYSIVFMVFFSSS